MHRRMTVAVAALLFAAACNQDPTSASSTTNELVLAQNAQVIADNVAATRDGGTTCEGWFRRVIDTLRTTDNPVAIAYLDSARANRDSAFHAWMAGDTAQARAYRRAAFRDLLSAVIAIFPNAPERTGAAVDTAVAHIDTLRTSADSALAAGDKVTALALNLRGLQILHRLREHVEFAHHDHDDVADGEMEEVGS